MAKVSVEQALANAKSHTKKGELADAQALYATILKAFPNNKKAQQGLTALSGGQRSAAEQGPPQAVIDQLISLYNQGKLAVVVEQAKELTEQYPTSFVLWNILGVANKGLNKIDEATNAFRKVTQLNPNYADGYSNLGVALGDQDQLDEAIRAYEKAINLQPNFHEAHNNMGTVLRRKGQLEQAINSYKKAISIKPNYIEAHNNLGVALAKKNNLREAIASYQQALSLKPDYAEAYSNMGIALTDQGKLEEAIEAYNKALAIMPDYAEAYSNMGVALKDQGKLEEAIDAYNKALAIKPDYAEAYSNMGIALTDQGKLEEAIEADNKALAIKPDYAEAYNNMGVALKDQGKLEEAIEAYNKALAIKPDYAEAYSNMGNALTDQGKLEEAIEAYNKALAIKPDSVESVQNLMKFPYGTLNADCINMANNFLEKYSKKIKNASELDFLEAYYLMHSDRLDLAFDKVLQANNKKLILRSKLETMNANHSTFEKKLKKWQLELAPKDSNKLTKIFILAPPRSGKSQLENLLSKSQLVKPLSDAIKLQKNFERLTFEQLFVLDETRLCQQGFHAITTTNPHSVFKAMDIARQLPNAFFIFINRDKYDVATEIFRSDWITGHEFAYDPNNIFRLIELYKNASDTFIERLPKNSISISFEEILYQPNEALRQIEELISIQFGLKHLDFKKSKIPLRSVFRKHFHAKFSHLESLNGSIDQV